MSQYHSFTVDGFSLTGTDEYGVRWTVEDAPGWFDGPPMRSSREPRSQQAGTHPSKGHPDERLVRLQGKIFAPSPVALEAADRRLAAVLAHGGSGPLIGSSEYGVLSAMAWLDDAPRVTPASASIGVYTLTLAASDPLLYGLPTFGTASLADTTPGAGRVWPRVWPLDWGVPPGVIPGAVSVPNAGTAAYWPRLRIDGPVLNPVVTLMETGAWVRYNGSLTTGQWLDWDMSNRRVLLQGVVSMRHKVTSSGNWLAIPVGGGSITWTADTADPAALLSVWGWERAVS